MLPLSIAEPCSAYKVCHFPRKHGFRDESGSMAAALHGSATQNADAEKRDPTAKNAAGAVPVDSRQTKDSKPDPCTTLQAWSIYWWIYAILLPLVIGVVTTVWFSWGVIRDMRRLFAALRNVKRDQADDGVVEKH